MHFFITSEPPAAGRNVVDPPAPPVVEHDKLSFPSQLDRDQERVDAFHVLLHVLVVIGRCLVTNPNSILLTYSQS